MPSRLLRIGCWMAGDALCWFAFQCAALFRATVLALRERPIPASSAPLGVYIYAVGVESCATRLPLLRSVPLTDPNRGRAWHPREFGAVLGGSASLTLPAPPLPSSSRRYAPQCFVGGIPPSRLATCTTAHPPNRAVACRSARHSARRSASSPHVKPLQATQQMLTNI